MDSNESIVEQRDFDDPDNNGDSVQCVKNWGIITDVSIAEDMDAGTEYISGSDLNLQNAALSNDTSTLDGNIVDSVDRPSVSKNDNFKPVVNNRHKFKRTNNVLSPGDQDSRKQIRLSENNNPIVNMVFFKGKFENIATLNSITLKEALFKVDSSIKLDQLKYVKDSLRVTCLNAEQKEKIMGVTKLMGIEILTSSHSALSRQSQDFESQEKVIIFGVSVEITDEQICSETGSVASKRLQKKDITNGIRSSTETVILTFSSTPPNYVYIGIKEHKTKPYCPLPIRCFKCQRLGHVQSACRGKTTCPKCAGQHSFVDCPLNKPCPESSTTATIPIGVSVKCCNCNGPHSAAFWGCPKFQERKKILEIKTLKKIPYGEAVAQYEDDKTQPKQIDNNDEIVVQDTHEVFEDNRESQSLNRVSDKQTRVISSSVNPNNQDGTNQKTKSSFNSSTNNSFTNQNNIVQSTPWKNKSSQLISKQNTQTWFNTINEEEEYPQPTASSIKDNTVLESLLDKFLSFMVDLFLDLLPTANVLSRFKKFAESLSSSNHSNVCGRSSL